MGDILYDPARKEEILGRTKNPSGIVGRTSQRPDGGIGESIGMLEEPFLGLSFGFTVCCFQPLSSQWIAASLAAKILQKMWEGPIGKASGLALTHGMLAVCARQPVSGMFRGSTDRMANSVSCSSRRNPSLLQRRWNSGPLLLRRHGGHVF